MSICSYCFTASGPQLIIRLGMCWDVLLHVVWCDAVEKLDVQGNGCARLVGWACKGPMVCWQEKAKTADHAGGCVFLPAAAVQVWLCDVAMGCCAVGPAGH